MQITISSFIVSLSMKRLSVTKKLLWQLNVGLWITTFNTPMANVPIWCSQGRDSFAVKQYFQSTSSLSSFSDFISGLPSVPQEIQSVLCSSGLQQKRCSHFLHEVVHLLLKQPQLLIKAGFSFVQPFQRCGYYSRAATKQGQCLIMEIWYPACNNVRLS